MHQCETQVDAELSGGHTLGEQGHAGHVCRLEGRAGEDLLTCPRQSLVGAAVREAVVADADGLAVAVHDARPDLAGPQQNANWCSCVVGGPNFYPKLVTHFPHFRNF